MCSCVMNVMSQDEMTVMKLNQLLLQMRTDFLSANASFSRAGYSELLFNGKSKDMIPRRSSFHGKLSELSKTIQERQRKTSLPTSLPPVINNPTPTIQEEEASKNVFVTHTNVLNNLDNLLGQLETISEPPTPTPFLNHSHDNHWTTCTDQKNNDINNNNHHHHDEVLYASIDRTKKSLRGNRRDHCRRDRANLIIDEDTIPEYDNETDYYEEPQYATIDDLPEDNSDLDEPRRCATLSERGPHGGAGGRRDERYMLDDATRYLTKSVFSRHFSTPHHNKNGKKCGMAFIKKFPSEGMINSMNFLEEHSTLCRRLKTLEASVGITLKRQLHFFVKRKMAVMNVSGCVYCMYAFYEKHKREADDKAKQIRNTIKEQELLQRQLHEQKQQSDADREWLESEEKSSDISNGPDGHRRSWREGLHESGSKSDSEQLGYDLYKEDYARDILEKKLAKKSSPLRRSIPLWGFERTDLTRVQASPTHDTTSSSSECSSNVAPSTADDRSNASTPSVYITPDTDTTTCNEDSVDGGSSSDTASTTTTENGLNSKLNKLNCNDNNGDGEAAASSSSETVKSDSAQATITPATPADSSNSKSKLVNSSTPVKTNDVNTDVVYQHTTSVVKSVIELNTGVQHAQPEEFIDLVKVVGLNLRDLLSAVDKEIDQIPAEAHKEIEMAHRVLSSDMAELVGKMKTAQKYADTTLDSQNRRNMLQAAHALAIDAKNLFDTFSKLRTSPPNSS